MQVINRIAAAAMLFWLLIIGFTIAHMHQDLSVRQSSAKQNTGSPKLPRSWIIPPRKK